jgi:alpha-L-arabinofuranosidase
MGLSGNEAQLIHVFGAFGGGLVQVGRKIKAGEKLEVELWTRTRHRPVTIRLGLRPACRAQPEYASAEVNIDTAYYTPYHAVLEIPMDDEEAVFFCEMTEEGELWLDQIHLRPYGKGTLNQNILNQVTGLKPGSMRFPGSCLSTIYHWRYGIGPQHLRPTLPDPIFKWSMCYDFGTDEYLQLCLEAGIAPHFVIDIGCEGPAEAAEWAAYCREFFLARKEKQPVVYFNIGNEQHGAWESSHMTGQMYARVLREFVPGIRQAYPAARIIAIGETISEGLHKGEETPWRQVILNEATDFFDLLGINTYVGKWYNNPLERMSDVVISIDIVKSALRRLSADCKTAGGRHKIALTEWNYWLFATHYEYSGKVFIEPADAQHALFTAGILNMLGRFGSPLELACYYQLVNIMGLFESRQGFVKDSSVAAVFRLYDAGFPGNVLPIDFQISSMGEITWLDSLCIQNQEGVWFYLVNFHPYENILINHPNFLSNLAEVTCLAAVDPGGDLSVANICSRSDALVLPPLSITRLRDSFTR